ncbi:peptidoglycan-binding domain-containing protein [uncultured Algibacter sp.]|uniref:peptidoglycan-binding domain-containing protein n=1 Tax=uncultured Algibacter sp. TaxID=298659 RepID=UPI0032180220
MKKTITKPKPNFFTKNKDLLIAGGAIVLLAGAGATWYYLKKKKETLKKNDLTSTGLTSASMSSSGRLNTPVRPNSTPLSSTSTTSGYPIKYGSRHADVKVLQRYLKIYKADLGSTGPKRDGVDGIFGPKTARASKKQLGKSVFTTSDIDGMRRTLKTMGK